MKIGYTSKPLQNLQSPLITLNPLLRLSSTFAVIPPYLFGRRLRPGTGFKIYVSSVLILVISGYLYHVIGKMYDPIFDYIAMTIKLIDNFTMLILVANNIAILTVVCLWKGEKFIALMDALQDFDVHVNLRGKRSKRPWLLLILSQIGIFSILAVDMITWVGYVGMNIYKYFLPRNFQWYQFNLACLLMFSLAIEIKRRLRRINVLLWQSVKGYGKGPMFTTKLDTQPKPYLIKVANYETLRNIKIWYADVGQMVDDFNSLFGVVLLTVVLFNITNVVYYTQLLMVYVVFHNDGTFGPYVILNILMWTLFTLIQTMAIAAACDGLAREANRTPEICYVLLNDVSLVSRTSYDTILKEELLLIADQSSSRKIFVSAAGFFDVNFGIMGFVVASVTSYIIVTVQFISDE